jgi:hypothetical protein
MKLTGVCPKCSGTRIARIAGVADAGDWTGEGEGPLRYRAGGHYVPRRVLIERVESRGVFGGASVELAPRGETEGYVCAACGYFEEYLRSPASISWERIEGATWHSPNGGGGGPFR